MICMANQKQREHSTNRVLKLLQLFIILKQTLLVRMSINLITLSILLIQTVQSLIARLLAGTSIFLPTFANLNPRIPGVPFKVDTIWLDSFFSTFPFLFFRLMMILIINYSVLRVR